MDDKVDGRALTGRDGDDAAAGTAEIDGDRGTVLGPGPRQDPTVKPGPARTSEGDEIDGVPVGVARAAGRGDRDHSKAYYEMHVKAPDRQHDSLVRTIPRSPTMDSLLLAADQLPPLGEIASPTGSGRVHFERGSITGLDALAEDSSTDLWSFVRQADGADAATDENVIAERYRIEDDLGVGGMARIYRVNHLHLGKEFALKIIHREMSYEAHLRRAFFREAQVASQLDHPHIVKVTDFGVDDRRGAFIVMEYLRGETLRARIRREGRLRLPLALDVALQVAEAVHYMHEQSFIHCDLKSENVFLCRSAGEGRRRPAVKLIDFGLSRSEVLGAELAKSEVGGTPEYMAPEQIRRASPQPSIDVYALGILLYEMVTGELPFVGKIEDVMMAQLEKPVPPPSFILDEPIDERAEALILKALEKDPADRQGSMGQMIYELRTLMDMLGVPHDRRRQAVVRRPSGVEADGPRLAFEHCPCPLFRLDRDASIMAANRAFCDFVREPVERLLGMPLPATRIAPLYPELRQDLATCADEGTQIQHVLTFTAKRDGRSAAALVWLVPELDEHDNCVSFTGIIVPYHTITGAASP